MGLNVLQANEDITAVLYKSAQMAKAFIRKYTYVHHQKNLFLKQDYTGKLYLIVVIIISSN